MSSKQIEILGKTFNSEEEASEYYKADLKKRLPELKEIEGFPIGEDEDILALSNPPYYTACPNPYINEFIEKYGKPYDEETDDYHREPFVGDVSEGKNSPVYTAHSYHTKVPHKAIVKYIEHYTKKEDVILDGFCGSGMTGVASTITGRNCIMSDLSTIATFIAHGYSNNLGIIESKNKAIDIVNKLKSEWGWLYKTNHIVGNKNIEAEINYVVWSDVFTCPFCSEEYVYWEVAISKEKGRAKENYHCPQCDGEITKRISVRKKTTIKDSVLKKNVIIAEQVPVLINCSFINPQTGKKERINKIPEDRDFELINKINEIDIHYFVPTVELPEGYNTSQPKKSHGVKYSHQFYTKRNLVLLSVLYHEIQKSKDTNLLFAFTGIVNRSTQMNRIHLKNFFFGGGGWNAGYLKGTLYIPSIPIETSIIEQFWSRIKSIIRAKESFQIKGSSIISTNSSTSLPISTNTVDYIFTDPPFGSNIMYSELNFLWEAWLKTLTNNETEAVINLKKDENVYKKLMIKSFSEFYRILKPKRWITVEFNNSSSKIWNLIQESIVKAGFVIAQVSVLDKKQGSFKQVTSSGSVKSDLVISAYKPSKHFEVSFLKNAGEGLEIDFIHEFLHQQSIRPLMERTEKMLYSKMLSYYIQHGYEVRYDAKAFYQMLRENFAEEDGYCFNANQINSYIEYKKKMKLEGIDEIKQGTMIMFVTDEKSALVWLHNFLNEPKSFSDTHTAFTQLANIQGDEMPDLKDLLEQNFISENTLYRRPQTDPEHNLIIEKREKLLMRQFESLLIQAQSEKKKIKSIRKEAVQLGFETCYKEKRFRDILTLAGKLDKKILEENGELKEFVDAAEIMVSGLS